MRNKVITMCSKDYFQYGQRLLDTRHVVDADFVCYGPDLTDTQIGTLTAHDIQYKTVNQDIWDTWMQSLKFQFIMDEIDGTGGGITFVDWDTYFLKDWGGVFCRAEWVFGITVRRGWIVANKMQRGWANGGVIFANNSILHAKNMCAFALLTIEDGEDDNLPEYDEIWQTLEQGRKPEKTHYRTDKRWWCDQIFLSALIMAQQKRIALELKQQHPGIPYINDGIYIYNIKLFDCRQYNNLWEETPDTYIMHLKEKSGAPGELKDGK